MIVSETVDQVCIVTSHNLEYTGFSLQGLVLTFAVCSHSHLRSAMLLAYITWIRTDTYNSLVCKDF